MKTEEEIISKLKELQDKLYDLDKLFYERFYFGYQCAIDSLQWVLESEVKE